jgi:hypothetical protein
MRRSSHRLLLAFLVAAGAVGAAACGNSDTPTTPTTPAVTVTETFAGTLTLNGATTYPFVTLASGTITVTLTSIDPAVAIGVSLGTWNGTVCTLVKANDAAVVGASLTGTTSSAALLCVRVADATGTLTDPVAYTVTVVHP